MNFVSTQFISICPWLYNELGHSLIYTQHIEKAVMHNLWIFKALVPKKAVLPSLSPNWVNQINCPTVRHWYEYIEKKKYRRPKKRVRAKERLFYYISLYRLIKKEMKAHPKSRFFLFFEAFAQTDIALITHLLKWLPAKRMTIGLVHRYQSSTLGKDVQRYQKHHEKILKSKAQLRLFTDSDLLKKDLEPYFNYPIDVLPIHYIESDLYSPKGLESVVTAWWPGLVREGKGLKIINEYLASESTKNQYIKLVLSEECSANKKDSGPQTHFVAKHLSREDYLKWLQNSDVILLPYNDPHYQKATSSIFIEAVMAGKMPLVYPNTWMAYELTKHHLKELISSWDSNLLSQEILDKVNDSKIREKLEKMRKAYVGFHHLNAYALKLKEALTL